jgi:hypothetical protein
LHWFLFALLTLLLAMMHVFYLRLAGGYTKEAQMNKDLSTSTKTTNTHQLSASLITTIWAIGTSAAAGVLSA